MILGITQIARNRDGTIDAVYKSVSFTYRDLDVWKTSMQLVVDCYKLTTQFPSAPESRAPSPEPSD
jgi:hypothetical protein